MRVSPASTRARVRAILPSAGTVPFSFWRPSRGPTSTILTWEGRGEPGSDASKNIRAAVAPASDGVVTTLRRVEGEGADDETVDAGEADAVAAALSMRSATRTARRNISADSGDCATAFSLTKWSGGGAARLVDDRDGDLGFVEYRGTKTARFTTRKRGERKARPGRANTVPRPASREGAVEAARPSPRRRRRAPEPVLARLLVGLPRPCLAQPGYHPCWWLG